MGTGHCAGPFPFVHRRSPPRTPPLAPHRNVEIATAKIRAALVFRNDNDCRFWRRWWVTERKSSIEGQTQTLALMPERGPIVQGMGVQIGKLPDPLRKSLAQNSKMVEPCTVTRES